MKVLPIFAYNNINKNHNTQMKKSYNTSFTHHPDFDRLIKEYPLCASGYFRRRYVSLEPSIYFTDILNVFKKVFSTEKIKKILLIGIGNSQEPCSYLSTIKQLKKDKPINTFLDLHILDLQSKPDKKKLFQDSYIVDDYLPDYAKDSFIYDPEHSEFSFNKYRVTDELFNFLNNTYNNSSKSKWETRVQEGITTYPKENFDIISINNVLFYLDLKEIYPTIENMYKALKLGGYLITEGDEYIQNSAVANKFERTAEGIFRKIK